MRAAATEIDELFSKSNSGGIVEVEDEEVLDQEEEEECAGSDGASARDQELELLPAPSFFSFLLLSASAVQSTARACTMFALALLFAAGLARSSLPSFIYAAASARSIFAARPQSDNSLRGPFLACVAAIAVAMVVVHILGSCIISQTPTRRIYVYFLPEALALCAVAIFFLVGRLNSSADARAPAGSRVLRALSVTDAALDVRHMGRFALLLFWASSCITPMGPCIFIALLVGFIALSGLTNEPLLSKRCLQFGRLMSGLALLIFWIGQIFVGSGNFWSTSSSISQLLYTDDMTSWSWDRDLSFISTSLMFFLLSPMFNPLETEGFHASVDSWLKFNVTSKLWLTILHCSGCFVACAWAGFGPALLILPAPLLASLGLVKCAHERHRSRISSLLCCYIVLLLILRTSTMSLSMAVADNVSVSFDVLFQVGLMSTEIANPYGSKCLYDASRHVALLFLGWLSCLIFSIERSSSEILHPQSSDMDVELISAKQSTSIQTAGISIVSWIGEFSAESLRFCACVAMYFVGLARVDAVHAVIFLVAVLYKPLISLLKIVCKSKPRANLWFWSSMSTYSTAAVLLYIIFNVQFVGLPSSASSGLGLQKMSLSNSWRSLLPIVLVMCICSLLTSHSQHRMHVNSRKSDAKLKGNMSNLQQPLLRPDPPRDSVADSRRRNFSQSSACNSFLVTMGDLIGQLYDFFMKDYFRLSVSFVVLLRGMGIMSLVPMSLLRFGYLVIFWMLVSAISFFSEWNGFAARWTKRIWSILNVYACFVIGIRYLYLFFTHFYGFSANSDFEVDVGLNRYTQISSNRYLYFLTDAFLVALSFIQSRRFLKLQKAKWQWPDGPSRFCFPRIELLCQNVISVHGDKGFLISLIAACLVNGISLASCVWVVFFVVILISPTALEFSWAIALALSMIYCTVAVIAPMPLVAFPGQSSNSTDPCESSCLMGFIGFQSSTRVSGSICAGRPFYCQEIQYLNQVVVSVCVCVSTSLMRLGIKYRKQNTSSGAILSALSARDFTHRNPESLDTVDISQSGFSSATNNPSVQTIFQPSSDFEKARTSVLNSEMSNLRIFRLSFLILIHNGFYAFAFEILVLTTCILIAYKPVDVWTSIYIIHLLVCLFSEVSRHSMPRTGSFLVISLVLAVRYALVLCFARDLFRMDPNWMIWFGLRPEPSLYPSMTFSEYFLFDFAIVLVSYFYQRHLVTSSRFSCVASDVDSRARHSLLAEYLKFAVRTLYGSESAGIDTHRFSFFGVYRQFCLNYDRISAFVGMFILLYSTIDNVPSLSNLVITIVLTLTLIQFESNKDLIKRRLWIWVNIIVVLSLFIFVVFQSPLYDSIPGSWGAVTLLGLSIFFKFSARIVYILIEFSSSTLFFIAFYQRFGRCSLPVRQVALLGLSLIATIVYLRWKDSSALRESDSSKRKNRILNNWVLAERTVIVEKFKCAQNLLQAAQKQNSVTCEDSSVLHFSAGHIDVTPLANSDEAIVCSDHKGLVSQRIGNINIVDSCLDYMKSLLIMMIDKTVFVSQQSYKGHVRDYPLWMEHVWKGCSSHSLLSLLYFVFASNSTAIYVFAFVINHAIQEDLLSGVPLLFIFGAFLLIKPFPGLRIVRMLAYYTFFCLIGRQIARLATAVFAVSAQGYNASTVPRSLCLQETDMSSTSVSMALSSTRYVYFSAGGYFDIFVILALQLHLGVLRSRGLEKDIYSSLLDPFSSCKADFCLKSPLSQVLVSEFGLNQALVSSLGLNFGRHVPLKNCTTFKSTLRYLWSVSQYGATKFSATNGADYYARLFALELVALIMLLVGIFLTNQASLTALFDENGASSATVQWIGYSFLQFIFMLLGRSVYVQRSSSMHLVLHITQVLTWFPVSLMCLSENCATTSSSVGSTWQKLFLVVKSTYFLISSMQYCRGYDVYRFEYGLFPNDYGTLAYYSWTLYRLIPFVYELQLLVDWTSTRTTLLFEQWIDVEQLMAYVFLQRCTLQYKEANNVTSGRVLSILKLKIWKGLGLVLVVTLILWGPLVLSVLGQTLISPYANPVNNASVQVSMNIESNLVKAKFTLFSMESIAMRSKSAQEQPMSCDSNPLNPLISASQACSELSRRYREKVQIQNIFFNHYADSIWTATPESRTYIANLLNTSHVSVIFSATWTVLRQPSFPNGPLDYSPSVSYTSSTPSMDSNQLTNLSIIFNNQNASALLSVMSLIPPVLEARTTSMVAASNNSSIVGLSLLRGLTEVGTSVQWWSMQNNVLSSNQSFSIFVVSQPVAFAVFAYFRQSVTAIYLLIIGFSAARLRTLVVSNISDIWLQQSACPDHLWQLAVSIWVARNAGQFSLESELYRQLIELLRSPDALIQIGKDAKKKKE